MSTLEQTLSLYLDGQHTAAYQRYLCDPSAVKPHLVMHEWRQVIERMILRRLATTYIQDVANTK